MNKAPTRHRRWPAAYRLRREIDALSKRGQGYDPLCAELYAEWADRCYPSWVAVLREIKEGDRRYEQGQPSEVTRAARALVFGQETD